MTSLRQCTTIFHHLAPEIIDAFGTVRERRHRVHIELGAVRKQERQLRSYLPSHTPGQNEWTIDSIKLATRVPDTYNDSENRLYTRADEDVGSAGHLCTCEAVNKAIDQWKGLYTDKCFQIHLGDDPLTYNTSHVTR
jgi:hypothetical protein